MGSVGLDPTKVACDWQVPKVSGLGFLEQCSCRMLGREV